MMSLAKMLGWLVLWSILGLMLKLLWHAPTAVWIGVISGIVWLFAAFEVWRAS